MLLLNHYLPKKYHITMKRQRAYILSHEHLHVIDAHSYHGVLNTNTFWHIRLLFLHPLL